MTFGTRSALVACALFLAWPAAPSQAAGATNDADLRGVDGIRMTISPMPPEAVDCGLDGATLVRNLEHRVNAGGLGTASDDEVVATITVLSAYQPGRCNSSVMLGAYRKASFFDHSVGWLRTGYVVLWQSGVLVTSAPDSHLDGVRNAIERLGDALVEDWRRANDTATTTQ